MTKLKLTDWAIRIITDCTNVFWDRTIYQTLICTQIGRFFRQFDSPSDEVVPKIRDQH
jgi:hypothetical protein